MSKLFYTSSYIAGKKFTDLESVFEFTAPSELILIFDTNVVIEYRNYFFNPTQFTHSKKKEFLKSLRSLFKNIEKFNLEVNASFGVEESCREPFDFSLNRAKFEQTHLTVKGMLHSGISAFDNHLTTRQYFGKEVKMKRAFPLSKINCLKQKTTYQHLIIPSYILILKTIELHYQILNSEVEKVEAFRILLEFMRNELDLLSGMHSHYAVHLFGGAPNYKSLWNKKGRTNEEKLHNIYNGCIDLICPIITCKTQQIYDNLGAKKRIPIFVSGDIVLSSLHSHRNIKLLFEADPYRVQNTFTPEGVAYEFDKEILNWTHDDYIQLNQLGTEFSTNARNGFENSPRKMLKFLKLVEDLEKRVLDRINS